jgi:hypothetical protein
MNTFLNLKIEKPSGIDYDLNKSLDRKIAERGYWEQHQVRFHLHYHPNQGKRANKTYSKND